MHGLGRDRGGNAVAHRSVVGRELRSITRIAVQASEPAYVVARAVREDRGLGQALAQAGDDLPQIELARHGPRRLPLVIGGMGRFGAAPPRRGVDPPELRQSGAERSDSRLDREARLVYAAQLVRAGMNVDQ